ncbi:MAG: hypothetical protein ACQ5SW_04640 [Sphaerochaetaceae bacterium]
MNRRIILPIILMILTLSFGCQTYTAKTAKEHIQVPEPTAEGTLVTKYSILEAEKQAEKEAEEAALLTHQQREEEAKQKALLDTAQQTIVVLQAEMEQLERTLQADTQALSKEQETSQNLRNLLQENDAVEQEHQDAITSLELQIEEKQKALAEAGDSYEMISYQVTELENLLAEQQTINNELQTILHEAETDHTTEVQSLKEKNEKTMETLHNTIESLQADNAILTVQLEEKTQSLEERLHLEQQRLDEAKRMEEARQERQQALEEEQRKAEEAEQARIAALEAEYQQIPLLSDLTFPRLYTTDETTTLAQENAQLNILMLPLDDAPWNDKNMASLIQTSISDLEAPVIMITGHMQNVIDVVKQLRRNAILVEGGAIITSFPILSTTKHGASVQFSDTKTIRLSIANLPEYKVLETFFAGEDWQTVQKQVTKERSETLKEILSEGTVTEPTVIGASLFEPSYQDWNTFSPVQYRQIDYIWPLSNFLEEASFYDVYRTTHFSADTDAGNTFLMENLKERIDYLYSRKILPLHSSMLTIGGESLSDAQGIARYGISATFVVP